MSPTITSPAMTAMRDDSRHRGLHGARAGARQGRRQARRHLGVRRGAVRDADGAARVRRRRRRPTRSRRVVASSRTGRRCRQACPTAVRRVAAAPACRRTRSSGSATCRACASRSRARSRRRRRDSALARRGAPRSVVARALPWAIASVAVAPRGRAADALGALAIGTRAHAAQAARQHRRRRVAADQPRRVGDSVAGRHDPRVRRATGRPGAPVHPQARPVAGRPARRHRRRRESVLLAGRPVAGVLRRRRAEEDLGDRGRRGHALRRRARTTAARGPTTTRFSSTGRAHPPRG